MNWENIKYEDFTTPIYYLQKGLDKLEKYGMPTFLQYSREVELSFCDINRVIRKAILRGKAELKEIPCPPELRQKRLDCYTKSFRYSDNKAMELIKELETFDGTQPKSFDIEKLASGVLRGV